MNCYTTNNKKSMKVFTYIEYFILCKTTSVFINDYINACASLSNKVYLS